MGIVPGCICEPSMGIAPVEPEGWAGAGIGIGIGLGMAVGLEGDCARIGIFIPWLRAACEWPDSALSGAVLLAFLVFAADLFGEFFLGFDFFVISAGLVFFGMGICMPGMFICSARAGAEKEASATALAASNNSIFTAGLRTGAPPMSGASRLRVHLLR